MSALTASTPTLPCGCCATLTTWQDWSIPLHAVFDSRGALPSRSLFQCHRIQLQIWKYPWGPAEPQHLFSLADTHPCRKSIVLPGSPHALHPGCLSLGPSGSALVFLETGVKYHVEFDSGNNLVLFRLHPVCTVLRWKAHIYLHHSIQHHTEVTTIFPVVWNQNPVRIWFVWMWGFFMIFLEPNCYSIITGTRTAHLERLQPCDSLLTTPIVLLIRGQASH